MNGLLNRRPVWRDSLSSFTGPHRLQDPPRCQRRPRRGKTFRTWAPRATAVYVVGTFNKWTVQGEAFRLVKDGAGV
jgi:1,4-alpha-glucan branching enzyme